MAFLELGGVTKVTRIKGVEYIVLTNTEIGDGLFPLQTLKEQLVVQGSSSFNGEARPESESPTIDGYWLVTEAGKYPNFGNVELPEEAIGFIIRNGGVYTISYTEVNNLPKGKVTTNEINSVSGMEVLEAIPGVRFDNVKNKDKVNIKLYPEYEPGIYISKEGVITKGSPNYSATNRMIYLGDSKQIRYVGNVGVAETRIAFFDINQELISVYPNNNDSITNVIIDKPKGAVFGLFSCKNTELTNSKIELISNSVDYFNDKIFYKYMSCLSVNFDENKVLIGAIENDINNFKDGYISPSDGLVKKLPNVIRKYVSYKIPVGALKLKINLSNWAGWSIQDINGKPLLYGDVRVLNEIEIPSDAYRVLATVRTDNDISDLKKDNFLFYFKESYISNKLLNALSNNGVNVRYKFSDIGSFDRFEKGYIRPTTGTIGGSEFDYNRHLKIELNDLDKFIYPDISMHSGYSFTDVNNKPIKFGDINHPTYLDKPEGAKFFLITVRAGNIMSDLNKDYVSKCLFKSKYDEEEESNLGVWIGDVINTFVGDDLRFYAESVFSGYIPTINYQVEFFGTSLKYNSDKGRFCVIDTSQPFSNKTIGVRVKDLNNIVILEKESLINCVAKPTKIKKEISSSNPLYVWFGGDSLIHSNYNEIGKEWLRMLNTNQEKKIEENYILNKSFDFGKGNIKLIGNKGDEFNKYTIANKFSVIMTGKNTGSDQNQINPFYNVNSSQPDELDSEGFNKRVDFKWYFESVCGIGNCPDIIYLACGVNDIVEYGWTMSSLEPISQKMLKTITRMKKACDEIKGGNSETKIVIVNHQFYPLNEGHYSNFDVAWQRKVWVKHYDNYNNKIKNTIDSNGKKISDYCYLLDASSQFDVDNGYTYIPISKNPRTTDMQTFVYDTVHIGKIGSLMYADALLRDFLYKYCN